MLTENEYTEMIKEKERQEREAEELKQQRKEERERKKERKTKGRKKEEKEGKQAIRHSNFLQGESMWGRRVASPTHKSQRAQIGIFFAIPKLRGSNFMRQQSNCNQTFHAKFLCCHI